MSSGVTQWARQSLEFAPERIRSSKTEEPPSPQDSDLCIGRPIAFHSDITPPPPSDRSHPGQPDSARPGIGRPIAFQSPSVHRKDTLKPHEVRNGERRWYVVGYSGRNSHEPKMISKEYEEVVTKISVELTRP